MSVFSTMFRLSASATDKKRDAGLIQPSDVVACRNIPYAGKNSDKWNLLDLYWPVGLQGAMPVIVSTHGGGYVYGDKEVYQYYCMSLAQRGFAVINFNYHLAPGAKFPSQLRELNKVMRWMADNHALYRLDLNNVFLVGDSAGAQMTSHYAALYANPEFAALYPFTLPREITIRAVALNCGMYDLYAEALGPRPDGMDLYDDYMGRDRRSRPDLFPMLKVLSAIDDRYPPAFVMTSYYDFLRENAEPMVELLRSRGVETEYRLYGQEGQDYMGHVFHCNIRLPEATVCNDEECAFFRHYLA